MHTNSRLSRVAVMVVTAAIGSNAVPEIGHAESEEDAAIHRGVELRKVNQDQAALEEFQKAYAISKSARALAQIGWAEQALGRWVNAETHLQQALSNDTPWIRKNAPALRKSLVEIQPHVGSLEVIGPPGAEARINGQVVGTLPFARPARLPIGTVNVELTKAGFLATSRTVSIAPGVLARESVDLTPARPPTVETAIASASATPVTPTTIVAVSDQGDRRPATPPARDEGSSWQRPLAWTAGVGAVLAAGVGVAALVIRHDRNADIARYQCNPRNGIVSPPDPAYASWCADLATSSSSWGVTAAVGFSVAGALTIASGVLFATLPSQHSASVALACAPSLLTPGAACQLRF